VQVAVFRSLTLVLLLVLMFVGAWLVLRRHERAASPGVQPVESLAEEAKHAPPQAKALAPVDSLAGANQRVRLENVPALATDERRELVVELPTTLVWHGRIVDGESGAPLSGAAVELVAENPFTEPAVEPARLSDAAGSVQLAFASWESSYARIEHPGYASGFVHLGPGHEQPSASLTVLLFRAAALELTVSDKGTTPRTRLGASVSAEPWERIQGNQAYPQLKGSAWTVHPDARGRCVFEALPANIALTVEIFDGFSYAKQVLRSERALRLEPGERRELNWTVGSGCTVDGLVLEADGRPAAGVDVWLLPDEGDPYFERYHERQVVARCSP